MSFNNWYKKEFWPEVTDSRAIELCKNEWSFKTTFMNLLSLNSIEWNFLKEALSNFYRNLQNYALFYTWWTRNWQAVQITSIVENRNWNNSRWRTPIFLVWNSWYQYFLDEQELLLKEYLDAVYQVRCALVHWSFDLNNQYFINLVRESYNILYPILEKIFENKNAEFSIYECKNDDRNISAKCEFRDWKFFVLIWSHIAKLPVPSFSTSDEEKRQQLLNWKYEDKWDYLELQESIEFDSPSWASNFCLWMNSNWWNQRKTKDWKTMSDILRNN